MTTATALPTDDRIDPVFDVIDATWAPASVQTVAGFAIREGQGGGSRVSCASLKTAFAGADIDQAIAAHRALGQRPCFMVRTGEDALDADLALRGYEAYDPVVTYSASLRDLPADIPEPGTVLAHWPPLAITREIWHDGGIGPERLAVMDRVRGPKTALLARTGDCAGAVTFVAVHNKTAMLHALFTRPTLRRKGLAKRLMQGALQWSRDVGATDFALVVTTANGPARAAYDQIGLRPGAQYHYRREVQP